MLTPSTLIISLLCGGLLGLVYGYFYKKTLTFLYAALSNASTPPPSEQQLKQRAMLASGLFFILRCCFVLGLFACMYTYLAINIPISGLAFVVTFLSTTITLARKQNHEN